LSGTFEQLRGAGDTSDVRTRLTSSRFVGRVGELAELELAAREAAARRPALVLLGGDSGVGKTRLLDELAGQLAEQQVLVLRGDAVEQSDGELPYAPLLGALRPLVREPHPVLATLGEGSRTQLAALLPGLDYPRARPEDGEPAGQLPLFEALLELIHALSEIAPLALVLEDMHWADRSTRAFVSFLARSLHDERVLLVLSFRTDELHRRHPLRALLAELERLGKARRVELSAFEKSELAEALCDILGGEPGEELIMRLYARSEGNALYSEELLAAGLDGRGAAPASLRDAFLLRVERLSEDAQRVSRAIAAGRRLDQATIAAVTGFGAEQLNAALHEAVDEQVLVQGADDQLAFRHALLREAVVDDLLPGERGELHLALAHALEQQAESGVGDKIERAMSIASHYAAAGDQPAALRATVDAALAARCVHAYGEVADLADRALDLWPRIDGAAELLGFDHVELLSIAAEACSLSGDRNRGEVLVNEALRELDPEADPNRYAALLGRLARIQWALSRGQEALDTAKRALGILEPANGGRERALLLAWLARTQFLRGRFRDAVRDGEEALAAAEATGNKRAEGEVLCTLGMARITLGQVDQGVLQIRRSIELARATDDVDRLGYAYNNLADLLSLAGRTAEGLEVAREGVATGLPRASLEWMHLTISELAFLTGDWAQSRALLEAVPSELVGVHLIFRDLRGADMALGDGDDDLAGRYLEEVEALVATSSEPQWIGHYGALLGELRRRRRDLTGARAAVAQALDRIELCTEDVMRIARVTAVGLRIEADIAQRARDLRETAEERDALARARIHSQRLRAAASEGGPVERAWKAFGDAELARARGRSDAAAWHAAAAAWEAIERPYPAAIAHRHEAEAHAENDDRVAAAAAASSALEVARRLGSRWLEAELGALCDRARLVLASGEGGHAPAPEPATDPFGLTPRERQVLALLAEGATNRQIGSALFMAEKTASVHVSRILGKLGVRSRTQAAAVAHRHDLAGS
jgi:DNA-binding CsgD family transcriptional regulator/tetratricopeptide (TPR) repeat protein